MRELERETHREQATQDEGGEGDAFARRCISLPLLKLPSPPLPPIRAERKKKNDEGERLMERRVTAVFDAADSKSAQDHHHRLYHKPGRKGAASPVAAAISVEIAAVLVVVQPIITL